MNTEMILSDKAKAFLAKNPAKLGVSGNRTYYEHPDFGGEVPMFYISEEGKLKKSVHWDMESASDTLWNSFD